MAKKKFTQVVICVVVVFFGYVSSSLHAAPADKETAPTLQRSLPGEKETNPPSSSPVKGETMIEVKAKRQIPSKLGVPRGDEGANKISRLESEEDVMEKALELLNSSQDAWSRGDIENALNFLDQAYAIILDTNGDAEIARQKDDLRLLISKQILSVYTSRRTVTSGMRGEIPMVMNAEVEREIRSFQTIERDFFISAYQRAASIRPIILKALKKAGLPEELSWLPLVESGFKIRALSRARALGLWQFIPSTGYKYGLNRDEWVDERMDIEKSTEAAISYLKDLHEMFGDWLTVLAAYNCGEGKVMRVIANQHINYLDRFWDLYNQLPNETARYVPRFLATLEIIKNPKKYGIDLETLPNDHSLDTYDTVMTNKILNLDEIASRLGISEDLLATLNAELRYKKTPDREYRLKVPLGMGERLASIMDELPEADRPFREKGRGVVIVRHKVRSGETMASIARKYRISPDSLKKYNKSLRATDTVKVGQRIVIPVATAQTVKTNNKQGIKKVALQAITYKVKKGDTLYSVAERYGMSIQELKKLNKIKGNILKTGQIITVKPKEVSENRETGSQQKKKIYVVKKGDNLHIIARRTETDVDTLKKLNNLPEDGNVRPGQALYIR